MSDEFDCPSCDESIKVADIWEALGEIIKCGSCGSSFLVGHETNYDDDVYFLLTNAPTAPPEE